ncbi:BREX-1 system phosphatase PglZ type B [Rhodanobacter aciditrophus]|uniref:BREX-1 system phosphatase PglZ type B n=1 Tax=Rhodanobacter aciditrophus TaxID=1623218 RepID=A0ABW4B477_9GAMM
MKIIDALIKHIRRLGDKADLLALPPAAILWTDKDAAWQPAMPLLKSAMPELLELGDYNPEQRTGPAVWLKCVIAGLASPLETDKVPVIYLPGISRSELRAIESCPGHLAMLAELQYRSRWWSTPNNNRDWTVSGFLANNTIGLELDIAKDKVTQETLSQVLEPLLEAEVNTLQGKRITSAELGALVVEDPLRDLLHWLDNPANADSWSPMRQTMLQQYCQREYGLNADTNNRSTFLANLCEQPQPVWSALWARFEDMAERLPGLLKQLETVEPLALALNSECYLSLALKEEQVLAKTFADMANKSDLEIEPEITRLQSEHAGRNESLWSRLGYTPYACALPHFDKLVELKNKPFGGPDIDIMASAYEREFWQLDYAALQAMACAQHDSHRQAIEGVLKVIYTPWLESRAEYFQKLIKENGYNSSDYQIRECATASYQTASQVVFFVDGLRFDVAREFAKSLEVDYSVAVSTQWSALPSLTATAKAAVMPIKALLDGDVDSSNFIPRVKSSGSDLSPTSFKKLLEQEGWQYLDGVETGDPSGLAWVQTGDLDKAGHKEQLRLPSRIADILDEVIARVHGLKQAGWQHIRIVTDHGWLWVPGGMPKATLNKNATIDKTLRCAMMKSAASSEHITAPWYWNNHVNIAFAPGIKAFRAGSHYDHGGLSLQECLTPVIDIR